MSGAGPSAGTPISAINVGDHRPLNADSVRALAESIRVNGLLCPIVVEPRGNRFLLIAGAHRLAACKSLGWDRIPANHRAMVDGYHDNGVSGQRFRTEHQEILDELAQLDENLVRLDMGASLDAATARKVELMKLLGLATGSGGRRRGAGAPKPKTETRGQASKRAARGTDNQTGTTPENCTATQPKHPGNRREGTEPGRPPEPAATAVKAVAEQLGKSESAVRKRIARVQGRRGKKAPAEYVSAPTSPIEPEPSAAQTVAAPAPRRPHYDIVVDQLGETHWAARCNSPAASADGHSRTEALVELARALDELEAP